MDPLSPLPYWRQLADALAERIAAGEWEPLTPLPSIPALMAEYGVSRGTVRHALADLVERGLIATTMGRLAHVRPQD